MSAFHKWGTLESKEDYARVIYMIPQNTPEEMCDVMVLEGTYSKLFYQYKIDPYLGGITRLKDLLYTRVII
jgi:hypothetical protein